MRDAAISINPATGEHIARYAYDAAADVERTLSQSIQGMRQWQAMPMAERSQCYRRMAEVLRAQQRRYAEMITREMGKLIGESMAEIEKCAALCAWYAEHGPRMLADEMVDMAPKRAYVSFAPLGLILGIMPWNFPFWQAMRAAVPIMLSGNGFLLKHASNVMGCAYLLRDAWQEAGLPEGTFAVANVPASQAEMLIAHADVAAVTLTGSVRAGSAVAAAAGKLLKKSLLELGGSDPFIVLADADLDAAVTAAIKARYSNAGQVCIAAKRLIVAREVAAKFTQQFVAAVQQLRIGDPLAEGTTLAPLARADLRENLHDQVTKSVQQGATLLLGGKAVSGPGNFYEATVLAGVTPDMPVFHEETFGPVAAIIEAADAAEAVALANQSKFGLSSNVWTRDEVKARDLAAQLETGGVFINGFSASDPRVPIGGVKQSGYGRELSYFGMREFVNAKTVLLAS